MVEESSSSEKKRGFYLNSYSDRSKKIPRTSKWRQEKVRAKESMFDSGSLKLSTDTTEPKKKESFLYMEGVTDGNYSPEFLPSLNILDPSLDIDKFYYDVRADRETYFAADDEDFNFVQYFASDSPMDCEQKTTDQDVNNEPTMKIPKESVPSYEGSRLTLAMSLLLVVTFALRHSLS